MKNIFATIALVTLAACTSKTPETVADTTTVIGDTTTISDTLVMKPGDTTFVTPDSLTK